MPEGPINDNRPTSLIRLTPRVSSWLYAVFAMMAVSVMVMAFFSRKRARGTRIFHQLATMILTVSAIDYFAMASNLGNTPISTTMRRQGTRAIWYSRYIDWSITVPLLLLTLLLATGLPLGDLTTVIFFGLVFVISLLIGALIESDYKWGFYVFAIVSILYVAYHILSPARASARLLGLDWGRTFTRAAGLLVLVWALYPVCWALSEGANVMGTTGEMIFYSILDILAKPVYLFMHITALSKLNYADLGLTSGKYSDPVNSGVAHHHPLGNTVSNARSDATAAAGEPKRGLGFFAGRKQHEVESAHAPTTAAV
ncbi:hypothetical protein NCC49_006109 [Naganishia albida]|nr:hypothetical protein NCC49_006109 [Naganishia albida]